MVVIPEASITTIKLPGKVIIRNRYCQFDCLHQDDNGQELGRCDGFRREPTGVKLCEKK